jgi:hypothetical protein
LCYSVLIFVQRNRIMIPTTKIFRFSQRFTWGFLSSETSHSVSVESDSDIWRKVMASPSKVPEPSDPWRRNTTLTVRVGTQLHTGGPKSCKIQTRKLNIVFTRTHHWLPSWARWINFSLSRHMTLLSTLTRVFHLCLGLPSCLLFRFWI